MCTLACGKVQDMHINTTVTREYYAQERYYTSASKGEPFLTDQVNDLNGEEEIVRDHGKTKDVQECFNEMNSGNPRITDTDDISSEQMEPLGMGMILVKGGTGYGMTASQITYPGIEDAVVRVRLASGDTYDVKISEVDPSNATAVEMFAYCQYADANGLGVNNRFGSWSALKTIMGSDGKVLELDSLEDAAMKKMDWKGTVSSSRISLLNQKTGDTVSAADIIEMFENLQKAAVDRENEKPDKDWRYMSDEEWDKFIEVIDEKIEDMQESVKEEVEKNKETSEKQDAFENADILTARYTSFVRRNQVTDPDTGEVIKAGYVDRTFYTREGIISTRTAHNSKEGTITDKQNWKVDFKSDEDYERTMKFLDRIPGEDNSPFTTREAFWKDYLNGEIDEDEFIEYYETIDHGIVRFIKTDENGNNYVDKEMTHSKYFKYFGLMQFTTISEEELQRGLELSALKDRGFDHYSEVKNEEPDLYTSLREAFAGQGKDGFRFYGEEETFSLDDWVNEIIRRAHLGLMDSLFMA